jgi:hypothetical protein
MRVDALADPGVEFVHAFLKYRLGNARGPGTLEECAGLCLCGPERLDLSGCAMNRETAKRANIIAQAG